MEPHPMAGVYAAAVTPVKHDYSPDYEAIPTLLDFLARRGCHGALILGTTGEGPSFTTAEREQIWKAALEVREDHREFRLFAGTGTPSLDETIGLTKTAFDLGYDGVVVLPPYYFRNASEEGIYAWFCEVIARGVPSNGLVMGYHFPQVSGVGLSLELVKRLKDAFPNEFKGIKDSSGDIRYTQGLVSTLGEDFLTLVGNDRLFSRALELGAQGCITALANLQSPDLRTVWDSHLAGNIDERAQAHVTVGREIIEEFTSAAPAIKTLLNGLHDIPMWAVRPPLMPLDDEDEKRALREMMRASIR